MNAKFAAALVDAAGEKDYVWVHDYHLMLVADELRRLGVKRRLGFFLHIPFPPVDLMVKMPWRQSVLEALLHYDVLGFQTPRDVRNFAQCVRLRLGAEIDTHDDTRVTVRWEGRKIRVGAFPISIDYDDFLRRCVADEVSEAVASIRMRLPGHTLILGLDRLDYSKGIASRVRAFGDALERYPELRGKVTLLQVVVPSREDVPEYAAMKDEIDRLVGRVNGRFTQAGWSPIQYIFRRLSSTELLAYYRACEVALITPFKDGMNLVAKEYCACSIEDRGVLVLSEFAGAAWQMGEGALLVNPFDIQAVGDAIHQAVVMEDEERARRMKSLRQGVRDSDIYGWVESFLAAAEGGPTQARKTG